jgi:1D-myo-inositol-tetrakisphosphate 5-kinase/inositol-polyphosphate multikinase
MYSASLLYVYEGDAAALEDGIQAEAREEVVADEDIDVDSEDEDQVPQYISKTKLIDFAHAAFTDGKGVDRNVLFGIEKVLEHLKMMNV